MKPATYVLLLGAVIVLGLVLTLLTGSGVAGLAVIAPAVIVLILRRSQD